MMKQTRRLIGMWIGVYVLLFFGLTKVALSQAPEATNPAPSQNTSQQPRSRAEQRFEQPLVVFATVTPIGQTRSEQATTFTWRDLDEASGERLVSVTAPAGSTAEEVLRTILENRALPRHIREPFVELAKAKTPQLLREVGDQANELH